jgi:hypothetical protein
VSQQGISSICFLAGKQAERTPPQQEGAQYQHHQTTSKNITKHQRPTMMLLLTAVLACKQASKASY